MAEETGTGTAELGRGATIGRYLVLTLLGKGGMGEVYAAYDPELDRKVAIKVLRGTSTAGVDAAEGRARILREAQAMAQLSDPNVVAVYDVGTFGERVFLAMEFIDGGTLSFWQQAQVRSWREIVDAYSGAGRGLAAAHRRGLVHRDFKPENAMVGRDGQVRVMDFGLARSDAAPVPAGEAGETGRTGSMPRRPAVVTGERVSGVQSPASTPSPAGNLAITRTPGLDGAAASEQPAGARLTPAAVAALQAAAEASLDGATRDLNKPPSLEVSPAQSPAALAWALTESGAMMGTPAYMSPEQFGGKVADAKSDQFAFCVALYEALYGERPFAGKNLPDLTRQVLSGRVRDVPQDSRTPGWVRRVLLRGLRVNRDERHASMEALLTELARDPSRLRRRYLAAASVVGLIAVLSGGLIQASQRQKMKCLGADAKLAGVWELPGRPGVLSSRKEAIRQAFMKTGKRYAADAFAVVRDSLDRYVSAWNAMHRDACEATHLRGEQSGDVLDLRMSCLQDRFVDMRALTSVFSDANGDVVGKAAEAVQSLRSVDQCADIAALKAVVRPPDDPAVRRAVADVRGALAEVKALGDAGKVKQAAAQIGPVVSAARETRYDPLVAEALLESAEVRAQSGDFAGSEAKYEDAVWLAEGCRHDEVALQASAELVYVVGNSLARGSEGERWARYAAAALRRLGPGHDQMEGWLANNRATVYEKLGRYPEALAAGLEAVKAKERVLGSGHFDVALSYANVANTLMHLGQLDRAIEQFHHSYEILSKTLGPEHPQTAFALEIGADILSAKGNYEEAASSAEKAIAIWTREWGPDNAFLAYPLTTLGLSLIDLRRPIAALPHLERALKIRTDKDPEPELLGETRFALARALWAADRSKDRAHLLAVQASHDFKQNPLPTTDRAAEIESWVKAHPGTATRLSMR